MQPGYFGSPRPYEIIGDKENCCVWIGPEKVTSVINIRPRGAIRYGKSHPADYQYNALSCIVGPNRSLSFKALNSPWASESLSPPKYGKYPEYYREVNRLFGKKPVERFMATQREVFLNPYFNKRTQYSLHNSGKQWWWMHDGFIRSAFLMYDEVKQAEADGAEHLVPAILFFMKSPKEIRKLVGKGLWKKIANASLYRNLLTFQARNGMSIMARFNEEIDRNPESITYVTISAKLPEDVLNSKYTDLIGMSADIYSNARYEEDTIEAVRRAYDCKAYMLKYVPNFPLTATDQPVNLAESLSKEKRHISSAEFYRYYNIVGDTKHMLGRIGEGERFNSDWSFSRMKEEHDRAQKIIMARRYSDEPFCEPHIHTIDGYTFTKLITPLQIYQEGVDMHHCVGSYSDYASQGKYFVYKVEGKGERATLGLAMSRHEQIEFSQCYGQFNKDVSYKLRSAAYDLKDLVDKDFNSKGETNDMVRLRERRAA